MELGPAIRLAAAAVGSTSQGYSQPPARPAAPALPRSPLRKRAERAPRNRCLVEAEGAEGVDGTRPARVVPSPA